MSVPSGTKFIGIASNVDTLERKSALANSPSQVYTIEDLSYASRPYKVFTALLTQSGSEINQSFYWGYGDDPTPTPPVLLSGVTYYISSNGSDTDFTVCGALSNSDTYFIANGEQPEWKAPYEGNSIELSWDNALPVVSILENTIGYVYLYYKNQGDYKIIISNNESYPVAVFSHPISYAITGEVIAMSIYNNGYDEITIKTSNGSEYKDIGFEYLSIEIRIYY